MQRYDEEGIAKITSRSIRPRARTMIEFEDVEVGDIIMVNYNSDEPKQRGYWYDLFVHDKVTVIQKLLSPSPSSSLLFVSSFHFFLTSSSVSSSFKLGTCFKDKHSWWASL